MNSMSPPPFSQPGRLGLAIPQPGAGSGMKWAALHEAAAIVARLAGLEEEHDLSAVREFPEAVGSVAGWRRELAEKGIDDLAAIMEPGIAALLSVNASGADPAAPALALWREFHAARAALLALVPPAEAA